MIDYELMPHQKELVYKSSFEPDLFIAWEMGTGKSCGTINVLRQRYAEQGRLMKTLILAPQIVLKNWRKEFSMYSKIPMKAIEVLEGPVKKRIKKVQECAGPRIFITNYDVLQSEDLARAFVDYGTEILVCDESHVLKNPKSKRARHVAAIADHCKHRYLLSGTPILNNALDLFMQFRILDGYLDKEATFGKNFFVYRANYFEDENSGWSSKPGYFPKFVPRPATYHLLNEKIYKKTLRVRKSEVLKDLPPLVTEERFVEMSSEQAKLYTEMRRDFVAFVEDKLKGGEPRAVVARLAITKALRLQQIVTGFATLDGGESYRIKENPRLEVLKALLEELTLEHKVIVWAVFRENYTQIREVCDSLGIKSVEIHGDISREEKFKNAEAFNADPSVRVLIGNPGAGGIGINLVSSDYSIYFSRDFKLSSDLQSEARNHRKGSEIHSKITRINLVSPGTIDELIAESLDSKMDISDQIIDRMKEL